jgi:hypothetical protein
MQPSQPVCSRNRDPSTTPWPPDAPTPRYHHTYMSLDGWDYWTMGALVDETTVINRAAITHESIREA